LNIEQHGDATGSLNVHLGIAMRSFRRAAGSYHPEWVGCNALLQD